jgi:hypothetical protein
MRMYVQLYTVQLYFGFAACHHCHGMSLSIVSRVYLGLIAVQLNSEDVFQEQDPAFALRCREGLNGEQTLREGERARAGR